MAEARFGKIGANCLASNLALLPSSTLDSGMWHAAKSNPALGREPSLERMLRVSAWRCDWEHSSILRWLHVHIGVVARFSRKMPRSILGLLLIMTHLITI